MKSFRFEDGFGERLFQIIPPHVPKIGPVRGEDGVCRLQPVDRWAALAPETLPLIPLKKILFPPRDELWHLDAAGYRMPDEASPVALLGIPPCDLYGLAWLDRVFAEDLFYRQRRRHLLVVGVPCAPAEGCFCPPSREPPPFDLFLTAERVWVGSSRGQRLLKRVQRDLAGEQESEFPSVFCMGQGPLLPKDLEERFLDSAGDPLWRETGRRCLSCGACSAVCPTCTCYDVVDDALPGENVSRYRAWDNCFFRTHALVAGGHNFRPNRASRLRFRFEHKLLGFGEQRGTSSCVGCGRCRRACPVAIDISEVLAALPEGGER